MDGQKSIIQSKHAYLIIAHNNEWQLKKLLQLLDDRRNDVFLHVDKKAKDVDLDALRSVCKASSIFIWQELSVNWGGYSQLKVELFLFEKAYIESLKSSGYSYFHLISGGDLPLRSQDEIHDYFDKYTNEDFIRFDDSIAKRICETRMGYFYFFQEGRKGNFDTFCNFADALSIQIQRAFKVNRIKNRDFELYYGSNWVSLSPNSVKILLDSRCEIASCYKYTRCCDEIYKHIILRNAGVHVHSLSPDHVIAIKRYINFDGNPSPRTYTIKDYSELMNSGALFARKFDQNVDREIIEKIFEKNKIYN